MKIPEGWLTEEVLDIGVGVFQHWHNDEATLKEKLKMAIGAMLSAAPTPPEVEPVGFIDRRGNFWSVDRAEAEYSDGNILELRALFTSPPSPKASWGADGNPLNLEAAARDFIEYMNAEDADRNPPQILAFLKNHEKNLRKFLGESS